MMKKYVKCMQYDFLRGGCMPLLQVRDFPGDVYEELKYKAKQENRSIAQQAIVLIKNGLNEELPSHKRRRKILDEINSWTVPKSAKKIDFVKWIREDRER